jgi:hypothetical protein
MTTIRTKRDSGDVGRGRAGPMRVRSLVLEIGLAAALGLSIMLTTSSARPSRQPDAAAAPATTDPSQFILNALLVPALDIDALPLRWVDPRTASLCGPDATVRVNGEPLLAGALVPNTPFELEWKTDACHPFGARGPRFDGAVKLKVFREDWGFSAMVEPPVDPSGLRVTSAENVTTVIQSGAVSIP